MRRQKANARITTAVTGRRSTAASIRPNIARARHQAVDCYAPRVSAKRVAHALAHTERVSESESGSVNVQAALRSTEKSSHARVVSVQLFGSKTYSSCKLLRHNPFAIYLCMSIAELLVLGLLIMGATQPIRLRKRFRLARSKCHSHSLRKTKLHIKGAAKAIDHSLTMKLSVKAVAFCCYFGTCFYFQYTAELGMEAD